MKKKRLARMSTLGCLMMVLVCTMAMPAFATGAGNVSGAITDTWNAAQGQIKDMEAILRAGMIGYAYVYPHGEEIPKVYVFSMTPENIANFIGHHQADCSEMTLTDQMDITILTTFGGFIDKCPDRNLLQNVLKHLVPIQTGQTMAKEVPTVSMDTMELYSEMLEQVQSEMRMEM